MTDKQETCRECGHEARRFIKLRYPHNPTVPLAYDIHEIGGYQCLRNQLAAAKKEKENHE